MKNQEKIKEILERIRSNKNNGTNELAATEEVATLNATNEATLSVASARGITTTTITADNYLYLESYDENGNAFEEPIIGNYSGKLYTLFGSVNMSSLLAANNLSVSDLTACYLTLYGDGGDFSWAYSIYDINGNFVGYWYGGGMQVYVPLKNIYDSSGNWSFVLEPATGYDCLYMSGAGDLEVSYNQTPLVSISITTEPIKKAYVAGDKFDKTGMVVTATYSNGTSKMITDYTYSTTALTAGMTVITISYMENEIMKTAMQAITVTEFVPTNLIATESMETIRDFSIAGGSARVDLFNHNSALSFQDISQENNLVGYPINHVYAKTLNNGAFGEYFSLNVIEKLTLATDNGQMSYVYKDAAGVGHSFSSANPSVGNWIYLSEAPASVWELSMYKYYQENPIVANRSRFLAVNWLTNGTYTKGFNTFGDLVMISDNYGNYLFIEYDSTGRLINIQDLRNDIGVTAFVLTYNSNGLVKKIEDIVRGKQITYTYTGAKLTGIAYESGRSLSFAYDSDNLTEITSSDGFISVLTYHGPVTSISTRATVDSVPSGTVSESLPMISEYSLIYKTDFAQVKDIDNNGNVKNFV